MSTILSRSGINAVLSCSVVLFVASCTTDEYQDPAAGDNAFLQQGAPRYGAGGTMSPSQNPGRYRVGEPIPPGEYSRSRRGRTVFLDDRRQNPQEPEQTRSRWNRRGSDQQPPARVTKREEPKPVEKPKPKTKPKPKNNEPDPNSVVQAPEVEKPKLKPAPKPSPRPKVSSSTNPLATPVPGQSGMVYSPFDAQKRQVDVTGLPSGSEARCPYTKKIFRVP